MGTDIHGVFQRRVNSKWEDIPSRYEQNRHYQLFAVLAGVRNGYGFAGVPTGEAVKPIDVPRGLPDDFEHDGEDHPIDDLSKMDSQRQKWHEKEEPLVVWMGDHSHSWLMGDEMLHWYKNAPEVIKTGIVERAVYEKWDGKSHPESYCGGIAGPGVRLINDNLVEKHQQPSWTHIQIHWTAHLGDELSYFFDEVERLVKEHGTIRFVFGFDS